MAGEPLFLVIDGHSQIYRALFSPGPMLTAPDGEQTTGTYVFVRMLLALFREIHPTHAVMALDGARKHLWRRARFPAYKATRKSTLDEETFRQVPRMIEIVKALGIPTVQHREWEADDCIATLIRGVDAQVVIVTRDKDLHQLVGPRASLYDPQTGDRVYEADVIRRWGVPPKKVAKVQALAGDSSDNVPGVPGIGLKRAVELIREHGSLKAVKAAAARNLLSPALTKGILGADLDLCLGLVTLNHSVPLKRLGLEHYRFQGLNYAGAAPIFERLGFRRLSRLGTKPARS